MGCLEPCPTVNEGSIAISPSGSTLYVTGGYVDLFNHVGAVLLTIASGLGSVTPFMTPLQTGSLGVGIAVNPKTGAGYWDYLSDFGEPPSILSQLGSYGAVLISPAKMSFWNIAINPQNGVAFVVECGWGDLYPTNPGSIVTTDGHTITLSSCPAIGPGSNNYDPENLAFDPNPNFPVAYVVRLYWRSVYVINTNTYSVTGTVS